MINSWLLHVERIGRVNWSAGRLFAGQVATVGQEESTQSHGCQPVG